jgi:MoaA/NifB/PqqE/SkfB family radical SAM enzyme
MKLRKLKQYLKFVNTLFMAKLTKRRIPLIAILCVTNRCNLKCWYCYGEHPYRANCQEFTTQELLDMIRRLYRLGTQILQLQGGEPLLRDDLPFIINEAHRLGMVCDMVTNGTLVYRHSDVIRLLDKVCISLDGPPEINDPNRGEGTFVQIVEGIQLARRYGLSVRISAILTSRSSENDIDWLVSFTNKYKVLLNFSPSFDFMPRFHPDKIKPHTIPDGQLQRLFQYIARCKRKGAPIQFTAASYNIAMHWPFTYQKRKAYAYEIPAWFVHPKCYHGDYVVFIDSDGSVYPCCNFWGRSNWDIRRDGLEEAVAGLSRDGCQACYIPAYIDRNLFFSGRSGSWRNYIIQTIKDLL